jgi:hypothetical protein
MIQQKAFTLTQGGADTAAETTIPTLIQPGITYGAWEIVGIEFTIKPDLVKAWVNNADQDFTIQFTKRSGCTTRIVTYTDTDLISTFNLAVNLAGTAANLQVIETTFYQSMPPGLIVYSENIYGQIISTATGQTNVAWGRILYNPVTLTAAQAMAVIASRP